MTALVNIDIDFIRYIWKTFNVILIVCARAKIYNNIIKIWPEADATSFSRASGYCGSGSPGSQRW